MLGHRSNNGNVDFGVASIPERVETSGPRRNCARNCEEHKPTKGYGKDDHDQTAEKSLELLAGKLLSNVFGASNQLNQAEDTEGRHVVRVADRQESNEWNLHASQCTKRIPSGVADIEPRAVPSHTDQDEGVQREQVGDENVTTPSRDHISIEQCTKRRPHRRTLFQALDPKIEGKDEQENGDGFVIVTSGNGSGDIPRSDAHEYCGEKAR